MQEPDISPPPTLPEKILSIDTKGINPSLSEYSVMECLSNHLYDLGYNRVFIHRTNDGAISLTVGDEDMDTVFCVELNDIEQLLDHMRWMVQGVQNKREVEAGW